MAQELFAHDHTPEAIAATVATAGHHVLMSLLLIVRQGWLAAAAQACGFILTLNPFEVRGPLFTCAPFVGWLVQLGGVVQQLQLPSGSVSHQAPQLTCLVLSIPLLFPSPPQSLHPIPEGLLGLVIISVGFVAYVLIAASGARTDGWKIVSVGQMDGCGGRLLHESSWLLLVPGPSVRTRVSQLPHAKHPSTHPQPHPSTP
jgi:hypothetical protein